MIEFLRSRVTGINNIKQKKKSNFWDKKSAEKSQNFETKSKLGENYLIIR